MPRLLAAGSAAATFDWAISMGYSRTLCKGNCAFTWQKIRRALLRPAYDHTARSHSSLIVEYKSFHLFGRTKITQIISALIKRGDSCIVPKLLTLYTHHWGMGKKNKVVKLTQKKIRYIIRAKTNNVSTKIIAKDLKLSDRL
jgi:hypothetical protein